MLLAASSLGGWLAVSGRSGGDVAAAAPASRALSPRWAGGMLAKAVPPRGLVVARRPPARGGFRPPLTAASAILIDGNTGTVLWAKREHVRRPIASLSKIMTAALALERLAPNDVVVVDPAAPRASPFREGLRAGERVPAWKLFYGLLLFSGNDDAVALAVAAGGSKARFVELMNDRARALGLRNTHFTSPSGLLDRGNYSTAWDVAAITRHALAKPRFRTIVRTRVRRVPWAAPTHAKIYVNKNKMLRGYRGADGVKTGWTTLAGRCLVASATRGKLRLVAVVLKAPDMYADARRLLDYGFAKRG